MGITTSTRPATQMAKPWGTSPESWAPASVPRGRKGCERYGECSITSLATLGTQQGDPLQKSLRSRIACGLEPTATLPHRSPARRRARRRSPRSNREEKIGMDGDRVQSRRNILCQFSAFNSIASPINRRYRNQPFIDRNARRPSSTRLTVLQFAL